MTTVTEYKHIALDKNGKPVIAGTRFKVHLLVQAKQAFGWSAEDLHENFDGLTLSEIYAALSYYYDHQEEIEAIIEAEEKMIEELRKNQPPSPFRLHLESLGIKCQ